LSNSFHCASGTVSSVVFITVANESELESINLVCLNDAGDDLSELAKDLSDFGFIPGRGEVLCVYIVECFLEFTLVLRSKLVALHNRVLKSCFDGSSSILGLGETNESVTIRVMVLIKRDFDAHDLSELFELFVELSWVDILGYLLDKDVLVVKLQLSSSQKLGVEAQNTTVSLLWLGWYVLLLSFLLL